MPTYMGIGDTVAWIQAGVWFVGLAIFIGRLIVKRVRGEEIMPSWMKPISSDLLLGSVVALGLIFSAVSLYISFTSKPPNPLMVTISAYQPEAGPLILVKDQTFENENVPLDGHVYDHCVFVNACLMYSGGAYQLQNATFKDHWKVCVKEPPLQNYGALLAALQLERPEVKHSTKSVLIK